MFWNFMRRTINKVLYSIERLLKVSTSLFLVRKYTTGNKILWWINPSILCDHSSYSVKYFPSTKSCKLEEVSFSGKFLSLIVTVSLCRKRMGWIDNRTEAWGLNYSFSRVISIWNIVNCIHFWSSKYPDIELGYNRKIFLQPSDGWKS